MAVISIDNLQPGMVLGRNVCDRSGRTLLPEGAELSERHLAILRMWGVMEAEILGDELGVDEEPPAASEEMDPALLAEAREEVERIFVHNDPSHPAVRELMRLCVLRRAAHAC